MPRVGAPLILCGTDLGEASARAADFAALLAQAAGAQLLLVHVDRPEAPSEPDVGDRLERKRLRCEARGIRCEATEVSGEPWQTISRIASERDAELIVVGPHGHGGPREVHGSNVRELLLGTTADRLVRYSGHPVLVVPSDTDTDIELAGARWLIAVDFAEPARHGLRVAMRWAGRTGGKPLLLHVIPPEGSSDIAESDKQFERRTEARLSELAAVEAPGAEHRLWSAYGPPADALSEAADSLDARILVLGSHGRHGVPRFFLGSTAERCLRRAGRPVLVVGPPSEHA